MHGQIYKFRAYNDTLHCQTDMDEQHKLKNCEK